MSLRHVRRSLLLVVSALALTACASTSGAEEGKAAARAPAGASPDLGEPAAVEAAPIDLDATVEADPEIQAFIEPYADKVRARANRVVGRLAGPLEKAARGQPESTLGNFSADAMRAAMKRSLGRDLDICFTNNGGLRRSLPEGEVTEGMLVELMPFENAIVVFEVDGARARPILEHIVETGDPASGLRYERKDSKPTSLLVGDKPFDETATYSICTNDYLFEGGGGYELSDIKDPTYTGVLLRDAFIEAFERAQARGKAIEPALDGRAKDVLGSAS